jgi:exo-beta-1,3-glucanase (GH17 family)
MLLIVVLIGCAQNQNKNSIVSTSERKILIDGNQFIIKGACYNPVPKGSNERNFDILKNDLQLMKEAGINTVRFYSPVNDVNVLNEINDAGIKVIMGFGYNQGGYYDILSGSFIDYVNKFKDYNAILMWELGNEYNYHPEWFEGDIVNWYNALDNAAKIIHKNDPKHPVTTAHGELPDSLALAKCPNINVWGMNVYRWDDPGDIFDQWKAISNKPMYLSEAGADSYMTIERNGYVKGVNEQAQADAVKNILKKIMQNTDVCSGVTIFAFNDEWWKAGNNNSQDPGGWAPNSSGVPYDGSPNEEYWGIVDIDRNKKEAFFVVKDVFGK